MNSIPTIDLSVLQSDNDETTFSSRQNLAKELVHALETLGCARLVCHGVDLELLPKAFQASRSFFSLDDATKTKYAYQGQASNRGYIGFGKECHSSTTESGAYGLQSSIINDRKETFDIGKEGEIGYQTPWPCSDLCDGFSSSSVRHDLLAYFETMNELQLQLLQLIAIGLGMEDVDFFVDRCNEQHCNLRLLHYPQEEISIPFVSNVTTSTISNSNHVIIRGARHTDFGILTLLVQDSTGGLRVETRSGEWMLVDPVVNTIIVQVGDMLQRWTGDVLRAAPHQVIQPLMETTISATTTIIPDRYSIAFFCNANKNVSIEPVDLPHYTEQRKDYEPINSLDYLTQRLNETIHCER
jgi:isopenicillin N synthase-like dioxygenase